jgi:hypothetical protein
MLLRDLELHREWMSDYLDELSKLYIAHAEIDDPLQHARHTLTREAGVHFQRQALCRVPGDCLSIDDPIIQADGARSPR